jgi:hypothetical protein
MSTTEPPKENSIEQEDVAIDVPANDLVHIGQDDRGFNHYYDAQRERILVVNAEHEEYTPENSIRVRRRLIVAAADVEHVQTEGDVSDHGSYVEFIAKEVGDRDWTDVEVTVIGGEIFDAFDASGEDQR